MKKSVYVGLSIIPLVLVALVLWLRIGSKTESRVLKPVVIKIDWVPSGEYYGFFYAKEHGIFKEYGFDVTIQNGSGAPAVAKELVAGSLSLGTTTSDNILRELLDGATIRAALPIFRYNPSSLALRLDKKISSTKDPAALAELKGARIGTNQQASVYTQFLYALQKSGLSTGDIKEYPIGWGGAAEFADKRVDGILAYTTNIIVDLQLNHQEFQEVLLGDIGVESYGLVLVASTRSNGALSDTEIRGIFKAVEEGYAQGAADIPAAVAALRATEPTLSPEKLAAAIAKSKKLNDASAYDVRNLDRWLTNVKNDETIRQRFERMLSARSGGFYEAPPSR